MEIVYIGLGSNLAGPAQQVETALRRLDDLPRTRLLRRSRLFRSPAWGKTDQPEFVNAVAMLQTELEPRALLDELLALEREAGRVRDGERWGPRVLDLDIVAYGERMIEEPGLRVPHPHLAERAFVLVPLAEIAPALQLPGWGPIQTLLQRVDASTCSPLEPQRSDAE